MSKDFHGLPQLPESALLLLRIAPARNMRRFYRLDVLPDLFGGVLHMKQWGRIGSRGQCLMGRFEDAVDAYVALRAQATHKERRGYTAPVEQGAGCRRLTPGSEKGHHADPRQGVGALIHRMAVWPRTQVQVIACVSQIVSTRRHRSSFLTGSRLAVRQPCAFHLLNQIVATSRRYCESVTISTAQDRVSASRPLSAAIRLLVVSASPPASPH